MNRFYGCDSQKGKNGRCVKNRFVRDFNNTGTGSYPTTHTVHSLAWLTILLETLPNKNASFREMP